MPGDVKSRLHKNSESTTQSYNCCGVYNQPVRADMARLTYCRYNVDLPEGVFLGYLSVCAAAFDTPQPMAMTSAKPIVSSDSRLMSPPLSVTPCSACSVLSPTLLTCLHQFIHVRRGPNLNEAAP